MSAVQAQQQGAASNRGRFKPGYDPRRHKFTKAECEEGFWAAMESIQCRYPDAVMSDGRHISVNFMKWATARRG